MQKGKSAAADAPAHFDGDSLPASGAGSTVRPLTTHLYGCFTNHTGDTKAPDPWRFRLLLDYCGELIWAEELADL
jgi:hypothetical protein